MSKGSQPSGNTTTTQINPTQQAQLPFLQSGWGQAQNLYNNNPLSYYPGRTLANFDPNLATGYGNLAWNAQGPMQSNAFTGQGAFNHIANGGTSVQNSPAFAGLNQFGYGQAYPEQQLQSITDTMGDVSRGAPGALSPYANASGFYGAGGLNAGLDYANLAANGNPADSLLYGTASGQFLGANPYIARQYNAAAQPVVNNYMTATAPQTDSAMEAAGRYGSGALGNAQSQNELNLGTTLGNLGANLYGQDYANERGLMTQAQGTLGNLALGQASTAGQLANQGYNTALAGTGQAAGIINQGLQTELGGLNSQASTAAQNAALRENALNTLQSGFNTGNQQQLGSLAMLPGLQSAFQAGPMAQTQAGQGLTGMAQAQIQDEMNRFYGNQQAPWQTLSQELSAFGQPTSGSSSTTSPYFTNPMANVLGAGLGGLGLYNGLNQAGLFGSGASGMSNLLSAGDVAGMSSAALDAGSAAQDFAGGASGLGLLGKIGGMFA